MFNTKETVENRKSARFWSLHRSEVGDGKGRHLVLGKELGRVQGRNVNAKAYTVSLPTRTYTYAYAFTPSFTILGDSSPACAKSIGKF